jgi:crotonobetainyl-CoA:carnitine CoA-transferase CaiB-like acyl-CoA transferase
MTPPLTGLLVLDFTTLLPGPLAALMLAEAGAEVVKIERPPVGDEMRSYVPRWGADSTNFALLNRGKASVALDLKDTAQQARLAPLLARADIVIEQFRPGVMDRLGIGYAAVSEINPRVIYCAITGYGQTGPKRDVAGHDLNYIGDTGLLSVSSGDPARPVVPPALLADIAAGSYPAFMNILLAVIARQATGRGCYLDVAMTDNVFPFLYWAIGKALGGGAWAGNGTDLVTGGTPRYHLFPAAHDRLVAVAAIEQRFWETFCTIIELEPALRDDAQDPAATIAGIGAILRGRSGAHWRAVFEGRDCCCSVVASLREAMEDPHFVARGLFRGTVSGGGARLPALPVPVLPIFRGEVEDKGAPALGADTDRLAPERA